MRRFGFHDLMLKQMKSFLVIVWKSDSSSSERGWFTSCFTSTLKNLSYFEFDLYGSGSKQQLNFFEWIYDKLYVFLLKYYAFKSSKHSLFQKWWSNSLSIQLPYFLHCSLLSDRDSFQYSSSFPAACSARSTLGVQTALCTSVASSESSRRHGSSTPSVVLETKSAHKSRLMDYLMENHNHILEVNENFS